MRGGSHGGGGGGNPLGFGLGEQFGAPMTPPEYRRRRADSALALSPLRAAPKLGSAGTSAASSLPSLFAAPTTTSPAIAFPVGGGSGGDGELRSAVQSLSLHLQSVVAFVQTEVASLKARDVALADVAATLSSRMDALASSLSLQLESEAKRRAAGEEAIGTQLSAVRTTLSLGLHGAAAPAASSVTSASTSAVALAVSEATAEAGSISHHVGAAMRRRMQRLAAHGMGGGGRGDEVDDADAMLAAAAAGSSSASNAGASTAVAAGGDAGGSSGEAMATRVVTRAHLEAALTQAKRAIVDSEVAPAMADVRRRMDEELTAVRRELAAWRADVDRGIATRFEATLTPVAASVAELADRVATVGRTADDAAAAARDAASTGADNLALLRDAVNRRIDSVNGGLAAVSRKQQGLADALLRGLQEEADAREEAVARASSEWGSKLAEVSSRWRDFGAAVDRLRAEATETTSRAVASAVASFEAGIASTRTRLSDALTATIEDRVRRVADESQAALARRSGEVEDGARRAIDRERAERGDDVARLQAALAEAVAKHVAVSGASASASEELDRVRRAQAALESEVDKCRRTTADVAAQTTADRAGNGATVRELQATVGALTETVALLRQGQEAVTRRVAGIAIATAGTAGSDGVEGGNSAAAAAATTALQARVTTLEAAVTQLQARVHAGSSAAGAAITGSSSGGGDWRTAVDDLHSRTTAAVADVLDKHAALADAVLADREATTEAIGALSDFNEVSRCVRFLVDTVADAFMLEATGQIVEDVLAADAARSASMLTHMAEGDVQASDDDGRSATNGTVGAPAGSDDDGLVDGGHLSPAVSEAGGGSSVTSSVQDAATPMPHHTASIASGHSHPQAASPGGSLAESSHTTAHTPVALVSHDSHAATAQDGDGRGSAASAASGSGSTTAVDAAEASADVEAPAASAEAPAASAEAPAASVDVEVAAASADVEAPAASADVEVAAAIAGTDEVGDGDKRAASQAASEAAHTRGDGATSGAYSTSFEAGSDGRGSAASGAGAARGGSAQGGSDEYADETYDA